MVELGVLTLNTAVRDSAEVEKTLLFLPSQVTGRHRALRRPHDRNAHEDAYAESFSRRNR